MKRTKRILLSLLSAAMVLIVLCACDGNKGDDPTDSEEKTTTTTTATTSEPKEEEPELHTHTPKEDVWTVDGMNHWKVCACGEVLDKAVHTVRNSVCTGCESEIMDWEDGTMSLYQSNEKGDLALTMTYDAKGNLIYKQIGEFIYNEAGLTVSELYTEYAGGSFPTASYRFEYTYNDDGTVHQEKYSENGMLTYEYEYAYPKEGESYVCQEITYLMNGSKRITQLDAGEVILSQIWYDVNGVKIDNFSKYDQVACKDLFGTWKVDMDMKRIFSLLLTGAEIELPADRLPPCVVDVTITFRKDGTYLSTAKIDRDQLFAMTVELSVEMIYLSAEQEGMTREEADAQFRAMSGMSIRELAEAEAAEGVDEMVQAINEDSEGVYYVENGMLYMAEHWNEPVEGGRYISNGDQFTLIMPVAELETEMEFEFTKITD